MNDLSQAASAEAPLPDLAGIEECFYPVVTQYGRPLFSFVLNAQLAQQAVNELMQLAQKHGSNRGVKAVQILAGVVNETSAAYTTLAEWSPELCAQCARDIERAYANKIIVPGSSIILGGH